MWQTVWHPTSNPNLRYTILSYFRNVIFACSLYARVCAHFPKFRNYSQRCLHKQSTTCGCIFARFQWKRGTTVYFRKLHLNLFVVIRCRLLQIVYVCLLYVPPHVAKSRLYHMFWCCCTTGWRLVCRQYVEIHKLQHDAVFEL